MFLFYLCESLCPNTEDQSHPIPRHACFVLIETEKNPTFQPAYFQIVVPSPDVRGRQEILELYLKDKPLADDVDAMAIARGTPGFNGAGIIWQFYSGSGLC